MSRCPGSSEINKPCLSKLRGITCHSGLDVESEKCPYWIPNLIQDGKRRERCRINPCLQNNIHVFLHTTKPENGVTCTRYVSPHFHNKKVQSVASCILLCMILFMMPCFARSESRKPPQNQSELSLPEFFYQSKQYYRSISEILNLKFKYSEKKIGLEYDILYLKSAYKTGEYQRIINAAPGMLEKPELNSDHDAMQSIGTLLTASYIKTGNYSQAANTWEICCYPSTGIAFLTPDQLSGTVDPDKARWFSTFLPGSGLLLSGETGKAAISFALNAVTLYGIHYYGTRNQPGIAGILLFFEIGWYTGGRNAAAEAAEDYNQHLLSDYYQSTYYPHLDN